jgi:predicted MFS family arabinose efflux permease
MFVESPPVIEILHSIKSEAKTTMSGLWADGRGWILLSVSLGWALSIGVRFVYPTLIPFFRADFEIGLSTTGLLMTMLWGVYAVGHVPGGILGDRVGEGNILFISTLTSAGAILLVSASLTIEMLFAGTALFALATALYGPTRVTIFTNIYSKQSGSAIGINMASGSLGNATFPVVAAVVAGYTSWRFGLGMFVPLFLVAAVAIWLTVPGHTSGETSAVDELSRDALGRIWDGIGHGSILAVVSIQVCISFTMQGFSSFYPTYLTTTKDLSPEVAATLFGVFFGVGSVIQPFSGTLVDRFGTRTTLAGFFSIAVAALGVAPPRRLRPSHRHHRALQRADSVSRHHAVVHRRHPPRRHARDRDGYPESRVDDTGRDVAAPHRRPRGLRSVQRGVPHPGRSR